MPAIITHHLIGEEILERTGREHVISPDARTSFLWGCQGPDPLFFAFRTRYARTIRKLATAMHTQNVDTALACLRDEAAEFAESTGIAAGDREVARAYALGYLCHFVADSTIHPFVYSTIAHAEKELGANDDSYVHATIESSLDAALLRLMRDETIAEFDVRTIPPRSDRVLHIIGQLYHVVVLQVYEQDIPAKAFEQTCKDMTLVDMTLYSPNPNNRKIKSIAAIERIVRRHPHSFAEAHAHVDEGDRCFRYFNQENDPWVNPSTKETSTASYGELVEEAIDRFIEVAGAFGDGAPVEEISLGRNFRGDI